MVSGLAFLGSNHDVVCHGEDALSVFGSVFVVVWNGWFFEESTAITVWCVAMTTIVCVVCSSFWLCALTDRLGGYPPIELFAALTNQFLFHSALGKRGSYSSGHVFSHYSFS